MKKIFAALLLIPVFAFGVAEWVTVKLDDRVTMSFPAQPEIKDMSGNPVWVQDIDKGARCMAMVLDFQKFGLDSAGLAAEMNREEAMEEFKQGVMGQIPGSTLISEKKGTIKGKTYFEYVINMGKTEPEALNIMYSRAIFVGSNMYTISFYEMTNKPRAEEREKYMSSFTLKY